MNLQEAQKKLAFFHQEQLLTYFSELSPEQQNKLLKQIENTDFSFLTHFSRENKPPQKGRISPIQALTLSQAVANIEKNTQIGTDAIKSGKIGAVLLAGGMGTRLGSSHPKGMYDIGITRPLYIFECIINNLLDVVHQTGTWIHLFIMTSEKNQEDTTRFFETHHFFSYPAEYIHFFSQKMAPASDYEGKLYLEAKDHIATSPNGNGGWFSSLQQAGLLDLIHEKGIEWLNCFAVDNVLQKIADPAFIGATLSKQCDCGAKVVRKNAPDEKVGVMCLEDSHPSIIEYYELTEEMLHAKSENGEPAYLFGVILNYLFSVNALERIASKDLPLHQVEKKIPYIDENGELIYPDAPNGYKFETLILDMIRLMDQCLPYEVEREKEFAPIKNKTGKDSIESARDLLKKNGISI